MKRIAFISFALILSPPVLADTGSVVLSNSAIESIKAAMQPMFSILMEKAVVWLTALAALQFIITNFKTLIDGAEISAVLGKLAMSVVWVGFCLYLINNAPAFLSAVADDFLGLGNVLPDPSTVVANSLSLGLSILTGGVAASAIPGWGGTLGNVAIISAFLICFCGVYFAAKIFMLHLEAGLIVMLSPISFAFLGLTALRDQGLAPFKSMLALIYRIILITVIISALDVISADLMRAKENVSYDGLMSLKFTGVFQPILNAVGAYGILIFLLFKSDSIASSLASGTVSSGASDMSAAVAAGAAAGALASGGASALAGAIAKPQNTMAEFMANMSGGGGGASSMSNASGLGIGGGVPAPSSSPASMSMSGTTGGKHAGMPVPSQPVAPEDIASPRFGAEPTNSSAAPGEGQETQSQANTGGSAGQSSSAQSARPADSGNASTASIGGAPQQGGGDIDRRLDGIQAALEKRGQGQLGQQFNELDRRLGQDHATTSVSINSHHVD